MTAGRDHEAIERTLPVAEPPVADMPVADMPVADMPVADTPAGDSDGDSRPHATYRALPPLGPVPELEAMEWVEQQLSSGLRVIAVRRPNVALVEVRLQVPFQGASASHAARAELLAAALLSGTPSRSRDDIAEQVQALGGALHAGVDADRVSLSGSALAAALPELLDIVADVLESASYPDAEVDRERDRLVERLAMARSQPGVVAREALSERLWGDHPYTRDMPQPDDVAVTTAADVRQLHADRLHAREATLVVVGDIDSDGIVDLCTRLLAGWIKSGASAPEPVDALPTPVPGVPVLIDRPGSVQSSLRWAAPAIPRAHPDAAALALANLVFGGYFSSRWVENIREDKGYTYSPRSGVEHRALGSTFVASADVATEVTAPAVLETQYELGRIATTGVTDAEVDDARQYAIGTLALSISTQAGLASTLSALAAVGLGPDYLQAQPGRLAGVTTTQVTAAARQYLAPASMVSVVVGDAAQIAEPLGLLTALSGNNKAVTEHIND